MCIFQLVTVSTVVISKDLLSDSVICNLSEMFLMLSLILELLSSKLCNLLDSMVMFCLLILSMFSTFSDNSLMLLQTFMLFKCNL